MDEKKPEQEQPQEQEQTQEQELSLVEAQVQIQPLEEEAAALDLVPVKPEKRNRDEYAKHLLKQAKNAVKIIKGLVIAAGALAGVLLIYGILALTVIDNKDGALIGFFVILSVILAIFIALIAMFVYAKIHLDKLKRLR